MDPVVEQQVLEMALREGSLRKEDLTAADQALLDGRGAEGPSRFGRRIRNLIGRGVLSVEVVEELIWRCREPDAPAGRAGWEAPATVVEPSSPARPVRQPREVPPDWDRYHIERLLGEGGMGRVYSAWDPRLQRRVALKFIHSTDPALVERFLHEARAQASIEHDNVCPIYEIGEVEGRPFIAMQYIRGEGLTRTSENLSIEERVRLMIPVAEALHAAHEKGLIHRDIKPGNILIERLEDGSLKPYVVDFGLAKELAEPGRTATGTILGTVAYMAPEQAKGKDARLDRRVDVYGLGATLYHLLAGRPPFTGTSLEIIVKLAESEPTPIGKVASFLPGDLAVVVMKALRRDPGDRYGTARELAQDLRRFLSGEPVQAQPVSFYSHLRSLIRRNPIASAALVALIITLATAGGWIGRQEWRTRQVAKFNRLFSQETARLEERVRLIYSRPLHNVRPEINTLREHLKALEREVGRASGLAVGPGEYALGRGHLALGDAAEAYRHLKRAWDAGYREPEPAYALGLSLAGLYREALERARKVADEATRKEQTRRAESQYRDPALTYLEIGKKVDVQAPEYGEAVIAFLERRHEVAEAKALAAVQRIPWFYKAWQLIGDSRAAVAAGRREHGEYAQALAEFDRGREAYAEARKIAPSDPKVPERLCSLWNTVLLTRVDAGENPEQAYTSAIAACSDALAADPGQADAFGGRALAGLQWGEYQALHGSNPESVLTRAAADAAAGLEVDPGNAALMSYLGVVHLELGRVAAATGSDPRPRLESAVASLRAALKVDPSHILARNSLGLAWLERAFWELAHGGDPRTSVEGAAGAFGEIVSRRPESFLAHDNIGVAYWTRAHYEVAHGIDPRPSLDRGRAALRAAVRANPNDWAAHNNLGLSDNDEAAYLLMTGANPAPVLERALAAYGRSLTINSNNASAFTNTAAAYRLLAQWELSSRRDPTAAVQRSAAAASKALAINSTDAEAAVEHARARLIEAEWLLLDGRSPQRPFELARRALERAIAVNREYVEAECTLVELHRRVAEWHGSGPAAAGAVAEGLRAARRATGINPDLAAAHEETGRLFLLRAELAVTAGDRRRAAREAAAELTRAREINALLGERVGPLIELSRRLSLHFSPSREAKRGRRR